MSPVFCRIYHLNNTPQPFREKYANNGFLLGLINPLGFHQKIQMKQFHLINTPISKVKEVHRYVLCIDSEVAHFSFLVLFLNSILVFFDPKILHIII